MKRVHIDKLQIRVKGISPEQTRAALDGLGARIVRDLADQTGRSATLDRVESPPVRMARGTPPTALRDQIARAVVTAVQAQRSD